MAIIYTTRKRAQPGVKGGGNMKYYADIVIQGVDTIDDLIKRIEKSTTFSEPDIIGVVSALINEIEDSLSKTRAVHIDKLVTFYPLVHSTGSDNEEHLNESNIISTDVRANVSKKLVKKLNNVPYQKVKKGKH